MPVEPGRKRKKKTGKIYSSRKRVRGYGSSTKGYRG